MYVSMSLSLNYNMKKSTHLVHCSHVYFGKWENGIKIKSMCLRSKLWRKNLPENVVSIRFHTYFEMWVEVHEAVQFRSLLWSRVPNDIWICSPLLISITFVVKNKAENAIQPEEDEWDWQFWQRTMTILKKNWNIRLLTTIYLSFRLIFTRYTLIFYHILHMFNDIQ